jgi:glycosyltransferase involved in cell wall biosynthesis
MKNQHMLIEAANKLNYPLEIIGQSPPNHSAYYDYCRSIAGPLVTFTGHMPQEELIERYATAKVHALPSWFETTGLSSLEAAAMGCQIVAGKGGDVKDYFQDMAWYCDPMKPESIRDALQQAMQAPERSSLREHILKKFTWERAAEETFNAYKTALNEE